MGHRRAIVRSSPEARQKLCGRISGRLSESSLAAEHARSIPVAVVYHDYDGKARLSSVLGSMHFTQAVGSQGLVVLKAYFDGGNKGDSAQYKVLTLVGIWTCPQF